MYGEMANANGMSATCKQSLPPGVLLCSRNPGQNQRTICVCSVYHQNKLRLHSSNPAIILILKHNPSHKTCLHGILCLLTIAVVINHNVNPREFLGLFLKDKLLNASYGNDVRVNCH